MRYLVTGGAGFIGSHLVERLLAQGHEVHIIDDLSSGKLSNIESAMAAGAQFFQRNINDDLQDFLANQNYDGIVHLAACPKPQFSIEHPDVTHTINVDGTVNILECARKFGVSRFVFASSAAVYGDATALPLREGEASIPLSPYALHKLIGEEYLAAYYRIYGMKTVALRFFNVYGPRQDPTGGYASAIPRFIVAMRQGEKIVINGDGEQTRDFIYVDDVVEALLAAATTDASECFGEVFNVGSGEGTSVNSLVKTIVSQLGVKSTDQWSHGPAVLEPRHSVAGIDKSACLLGWQPKTSLAKGLGSAIQYFESQLALHR